MVKIKFISHELHPLRGNRDEFLYKNNLESFEKEINYWLNAHKNNSIDSIKIDYITKRHNNGGADKIDAIATIIYQE